MCGFEGPHGIVKVSCVRQGHWVCDLCVLRWEWSIWGVGEGFREQGTRKPSTQSWEQAGWLHAGCGWRTEFMAQGEGHRVRATRPRGGGDQTSRIRNKA